MNREKNKPYPQHAQISCHVSREM